MKKIIRGAAMACAIVLLVTPSPVRAHGLEGDRFFPPTPLTDDPFAVDELSLPEIQYNPATVGREVDITGSLSKEIFPKFALSIQDAYINLNPKGGPAQDGWSPITLNAKYQLWEIQEHEFILSIGSDITLGGTGSKSLYSYNYDTTYTPNLYLGKGFNELPDSLKFFRPLAITTVTGYDLYANAAASNALEWSGSVQYSIPYLQEHVEDVGIPRPFRDMIPLVEFQMTTPTNKNAVPTTGTIDPGILWEGKYCQISGEVSIPINSRTGPAVGGLIQVQIFIDDLFPKIFGHPIFGSDDNNETTSDK
ncbi:MAG TPA: hypothetical protein VGZ93_06845 [Candidatus Methylacidiphilales bacterium]|jgi:hypothetical protein|nr:hypothetical protein [Candidatus Methylacidiphilales bacterium]